MTSQTDSDNGGTSRQVLDCTISAIEEWVRIHRQTEYTEFKPEGDIDIEL